MSFGKSKQDSGQSMDPQIKGALMNVFQTGQALSRTPYNPYQNATVAPMSPFQQQGMQATLDASRAGIGQEQMDRAIARAQTEAKFAPSNVATKGITQIGDLTGNVSSGSASNALTAAANNVSGVTYKPTMATYLPNAGTGVNAGTAVGLAGTENYNDSRYKNNVNVGGVNTGITFNDAKASTVTNPGQISAGTATGQDVASLGLLGPSATAANAAQIVDVGTGRVKNREVSANQISGPLSAVSVGKITPGTVSASDVTAGTIDPLSFQDSNVNDYMNQYQTGVIDSALGDIERARKMQQNQNASSAISAGAFGGDRAAIVEAETNRAALEQSAKTASALRSQGFESAARLAEADLARRMDAASANQQTGLQGQLANQQSGLAASQANAQLGLQGQTEAARLGLQAGLSAQDANMQAALANQQAGLTASQANSSLGVDAGKANQDAALRRAMANQQASVGDADRALRGGQINQDASLQARQQDLQRLMSNQDNARAFALANQAQGMSAQQSNAQNNLSRQQLNQDAGLRAALANQQAQLTAGQAANQGRLQSQSLGVDAGRSNQAANIQQLQLANAAQQANRDRSLQASLANQQTKLDQQRLANQGILQTQSIAAQQSRANQADNTAVNQLRLRGQESNQQAALQASLANQANQRAFAFQNQDAAMQAALANQQLGFNQDQSEYDRRFRNVENNMQAQLANQSAGLQGQQQRLAGAGMSSQLAQDQRAMTFADAQQMQGVGNQQQQFAQQIMDDQYRRFQEQQNYPFRMFDVLRSGAGMLPNPTMSNSSGRSTNLGI